jgi:hypothetical protein
MTRRGEGRLEGRWAAGLFSQPRCHRDRHQVQQYESRYAEELIQHKGLKQPRRLPYTTVLPRLLMSSPFHHLIGNPIQDQISPSGLQD